MKNLIFSLILCFAIPAGYDGCDHHRAKSVCQNDAGVMVCKAKTLN